MSKQILGYVWSDGSFCYIEDLEEFLTFKSDDYETVTTANQNAHRLDQMGCLEDFYYEMSNHR